MSRGFDTKRVPGWVLDGIESAFTDWMEMSGEWLKTAPEYLLTVRVAQTLQSTIPAGKRTLLMEPHVAKTLDDAGGIQRGPKATKLRAGGRFDIVLGHGNGRPRTVIEMKNPLWTPMGKAALNDLHRISRALLQGRAKTQLLSGVFAFYTSSAVPKRKDISARERLERRWVREWEPALQTWDWAGAAKKRYSKHLRLSVKARINEMQMNGALHAWAAICVQITRKSPLRVAEHQKNTKMREQKAKK